MKISRVSIKNFRSIQECEVGLSDFNTIVGRNNSGKTNFFDAVAWFYSGSSIARDMRYGRDPEKEVVVSVEFTGAQHGAENMVNEGNKQKMLAVLAGSDRICVARKSGEPKKRVVEVNGVVVKNPTGFDAALNDFLPKFEYIHTRQYFEEFTKYSQKSAVGIMLSSVIEQILTDDPSYRKFKNTFEELFNSEDSAVSGHFKALGSSVKTHLAKQFSECSKVYFEVMSPEFSDLLKNFETVVDDGIETYAKDKGDGMQRALMLAIIQAYAEYRRAREDVGKSFLFFIDEAELHLHPTAQRKLKQVLLELSAELDQVVISTHSSVFIADSAARELIFMCEKEEGRSSLNPVAAAMRPYVVYELLGGSPADLLLPRCFLIVEGASEVEFLAGLLARLYPARPAVQIVPANGDVNQTRKSVDAIAKAYSPMGNSVYANKTVVICDAPTPAALRGFDNFRTAHSSIDQIGHLVVLPFGSLEECYPDRENWKKTSEEVSLMTGTQKRHLAREVGQAITQEEFESMPEFHGALLKAWAAAI
ncbi:recombinational DNA repair ATPase RecF [Xanthomonas arboricola]|uniref:ATP-dependent nuclease n=1 Tax=Xanthomonas arboricola TaxID=56448 RepID=UPI001620E537|nr:AAA family ATPase [Xanthomonas arboricola]MBB6337769.1 recombinational DNA repair ATPase RecF [Xanthomonas arboricola]